ncbi:hypothetical protein J3R83DRAFT_8587 [Lanmaoa asiatica]|nr:hypothetical protein J3R83DRAFT_8587 [Lanmaoa asiatica]
MFHPQAFLKMVQEIYEMTVLGSTAGLSVLLIEVQAFLLMLVACLVIPTDADSNPIIALFKLYPRFMVNNSAIARDHIV